MKSLSDIVDDIHKNGSTGATKEQITKIAKATFGSVTDALKAGEEVRTGKRVDFGRVYFDRKGPFMRMGLPSGRHLHYCRPRIEDVKMPWGETKASITYESLNDRKQWVRESTHPGKLTENADQAIARDLLAHGMKLADRRGIDLRIHVHDQLVGLVKEDEAEEKLRVLIECMEDQPPWADGLPLGSNGFISKVFMKD